MSKKYKIGYTTGVFDMFHIGHLNILKHAKEQCETLIVGVTTDALCFERKGKYPVIPEAERMEIVRSIRYVDVVVPQADMDKARAVQKLGADAVFVGSDWRNTPEWERYERELAAIGCDVIYFEHTDGVSSSILKERIEHL